MKIVILDSHTLNPGDLSWDTLKALGACTIYDRTSPENVFERSKEADILLTNKVMLTKEIINRLPHLKYIGVMATGYNVVDIEAARRKNIPVTNVPAYGTQSVVQMVFAHLLHFTQHVAHHAETVRHGKWTQAPDFCYWDEALIELENLTMGIIGFGKIGRRVSEVATALGMKVLINDLAPVSDLPKNIRQVDTPTIFRESDVLTLHCPLTKNNHQLINQERLSLMKKTAYLINTARGPLINEKALADALNNGRIAGAGLDVLSVEPPPEDNPLLRAKNCAITPHIAWATRSARQRLLNTLAENIKGFLEGNPQNVIN
ncbi:D-2-hydroxyacid dehydrogenase [bacterium]|nr:D-2-hydroxyacid dehydrogenase [bacterium]RQV95732.1 MAG: D-2-hydroxyacid dehydrogenase [bacterium]